MEVHDCIPVLQFQVPVYYKGILYSIYHLFLSVQPQQLIFGSVSEKLFKMLKLVDIQDCNFN